MTKHIVWLLPAIVQAWQVQDVVPISSYDTAGSFLLLGCTNGSIYYIGYYYIILTHYFVCNLFIYCNQTSWTFRVIYWLEQFWTSSSAISFCDLWWHLHFIISESNFYLLDMMFHHFCCRHAEVPVANEGQRFAGDRTVQGSGWWSNQQYFRLFDTKIKLASFSKIVNNWFDK